jgi:hypothetical protein
MSKYYFTNEMERELRRNDLQAELVDEECGPEHFGNATAKFELGNLLLIFDRDRLINELSLAPAKKTAFRYPFVVVEIAMGFRSLGNLRLSDVTPIGDALASLKAHFDEIEALFLRTPAKLRQASEARVEKLFKTRSR